MRAGLESSAARDPATAAPVVVRRRTTAAGVLGQLGLAILLVLMLPLVLVVAGAPVVLLVRAIIALAERF